MSWGWHYRKKLAWILNFLKFCAESQQLIVNLFCTGWYRGTQALACLALIALICDFVVRTLFKIGKEKKFLIISVVLDCVTGMYSQSKASQILDEKDFASQFIRVTYNAAGAYCAADFVCYYLLLFGITIIDHKRHSCLIHGRGKCQ